MRFIFVTGGVVSSLGKGLTSAALGTLLEKRKLKIALQKFDPYLNVDPGTMSPFQHGEVYVLDDGAETDLDLGHYERFTNVKLSKKNSLSSGQIYESILKKERAGEFLGKTVQVIPHVTDEIKENITKGIDSDTDIVITEIGGVVGDIEGLPMLEAIRQFILEVGRENVMFIHVTLLPFLKTSSEIKTKPSQQSVARLREIGIQPDVLVCRTEQEITYEIRQKLSLFCNVPTEAVIEEQDLKHSIYELPKTLHKEGLDRLVVKKFGIEEQIISMSDWEQMIDKIKNPKHKAKIAIVGKYVELQDAYKSVYEALAHAGIGNDCEVEIVKIDSEELENNDPAQILSEVNGVLIPGGFGKRGSEGKIAAVKYARENKIPFFGICMGMQIAVIEFSRNVANLEGANSTEFDPDTNYPVVDLLEDQKTVQQKGGSMRLGAYVCKLKEDSLAKKAYNAHIVSERHRHRFEFNDKFKKQLTEKGLIISGTEKNTDLAEIVELPDHPWFVAVQFHPEFQSKPHKPHGLFSGFVKAALSCAR